MNSANSPMNSGNSPIKYMKFHKEEPTFAANCPSMCTQPLGSMAGRNRSTSPCALRGTTPFLAVGASYFSVCHWPYSSVFCCARSSPSSSSSSVSPVRRFFFFLLRLAFFAIVLNGR